MGMYLVSYPVELAHDLGRDSTQTEVYDACLCLAQTGCVGNVTWKGAGLWDGKCRKSLILSSVFLLDSSYEPEGREFDSLRVRQSTQKGADFQTVPFLFN